MKATIILAAGIAATSASAEFMTGNELLTRLEGETGYQRGTALGYVMGVFDTGHGVTHCAPAGVTLGQVVDMTKDALKVAPSVRHFSADIFVKHVLEEAWPCPKKKGKEI